MDLSAFQTHNKGRKMTKEERTRASVDLSIQYLASYYSDWRLVKVLSNKKLLDERYEFFMPLMKELVQDGDADGSSTIAQEIKNGIHFDSISHCVQYVEDLFALIRAAQNKDYFVRNIVTYKAGEITNFIKGFRITPNSAGKIYHIPDNLDGFTEEHTSQLTKGKETLARLTAEIVEFYKKYEFLYNQYKHGLSVALRPFGNIFTPEQIAEDKNGNLNPYLVVYDNLNLNAASSKGTMNLQHGVHMPGFTDNVRPFIKDLSEENNYLRFVFPHDYPNFSMEVLLTHARNARACIQTFVTNYYQELSYKGGKRRFVFPEDPTTNTFNIVGYTPASDENNAEVAQ
ncbi:MAG: hypothetical protein JNL60_11295 [Bacteroidia bacterium]|nr:hypothetical protein [Bacteroidia bacterium]